MCSCVLTCNSSSRLSLPFLPLPSGHVQASRALMIISLLLGLVSMIVSLLGLKCIKIGSATEQTKAKIAVTGGGIFILAGEFRFTTYCCKVAETFLWFLFF